MNPLALEHSDFGPADRHYHVPLTTDIPAPPKKGIKGWHILAGAAGVILIIAITGWVKYREAKKEQAKNFTSNRIQENSA